LSGPTTADTVPGPSREAVNPMRTRRQATIEDLRRAIACLPRHTRVAMLDGINSNRIIVGAYTGEDGICPMLAAHRAGGRTNFISFAKAWDRYAFRGSRKHTARPATERELLVLRTHLEASLLSDEGPSPDLSAAIREHAELMSARKQRPGDPDRSHELRKRGGWSWLRIMRRYDDYERALALLETEQRELEPSAR
jgi:hypothetical protein